MPIFLDSGNRCSRQALSKETMIIFDFISSCGVKSPIEVEGVHYALDLD